MKKILVIGLYSMFCLPVYADKIFPNGIDQNQESYTDDQKAAALLYVYARNDAEYTLCQFEGYEDMHKSVLEGLETTINESKLPDARSKFTPYNDAGYASREKEIKERPAICDEVVAEYERKTAEREVRVHQMMIDKGYITE